MPQTINLIHFDLKFYSGDALLVFFKISLVPLNFEVYSLSYLSFSYYCPFMEQIWASEIGKSLKIHLSLFCSKILHLYLMNPISNDPSPT